MGVELLSPDEVTSVGAVERIRLVYLGIGWLRGKCKKQYRREKFDGSGYRSIWTWWIYFEP